MDNLVKRILTAVIGIPIFLLALAGPPATVMPTGATWMILVMLIALLGAAEMVFAMEQQNGVRVNRLVVVFAVYLPVDAWLSHQRFEGLTIARLVAAGVLVLALGWEVWQAERVRRLAVWRNVGSASLIALYLGLLLSLWVKLRLLDAGCGYPVTWMSDGVRLVLLACFTVWSCDTAAYLVGKRFGRRRMTPLLSPNKSWEGALGGVLAAVLVGGGISFWLGLPWFSALILSSVSACIGQVGDLFESALKRELGIKDFGGLLPGHGGVMDRFDSLLFAIPSIYLLAHILPICP